MTIIVEDGSGVANSNSYVTRQEYIDYGASIGITITDDENADFQLIQATQFIMSKEGKLIGIKVDKDQSISYPRYNLYIDDYYWGSDEIPTQVKQAQLNIALDVNAGIDIYNPPQSDGVGVKKEGVAKGTVDIEYAVSDQASYARQSFTNSLMASITGTNYSSITLERR